jgi:hypothetical protein
MAAKIFPISLRNILPELRRRCHSSLNLILNKAYKIFDTMSNYSNLENDRNCLAVFLLV